MQTLLCTIFPDSIAGIILEYINELQLEEVCSREIVGNHVAFDELGQVFVLDKTQKMITMFFDITTIPQKFIRRKDEGTHYVITDSSQMICVKQEKKTIQEVYTFPFCVQHFDLIGKDAMILLESEGVIRYVNRKTGIVIVNKLPLSSMNMDWDKLNNNELIMHGERFVEDTSQSIAFVYVWNLSENQIKFILSVQEPTSAPYICVLSEDRFFCLICTDVIPAILNTYQMLCCIIDSKTIFYYLKFGISKPVVEMGLEHKKIITSEEFMSVLPCAALFVQHKLPLELFCVDSINQESAWLDTLNNLDMACIYVGSKNDRRVFVWYKNHCKFNVFALYGLYNGTLLVAMDFYLYKLQLDKTGNGLQETRIQMPYFPIATKLFVKNYQPMFAIIEKKMQDKFKIVLLQ